MTENKVEIVYQDKEVAVVVKPRGLLSEAGGEDSLPTCLAPSLGTLFPVHRLDRVVGGVMVYARTKAAAAALSRAVTEHALVKEYVAVLEGTPQSPEGELRDYLFKDARQNKSFVVDSPRRGVREAVLCYRTAGTVAEGESTLTMVDITLKTGRSHQIRVQFSSRGTPLVGDGKYGARKKAPYPALFAAALTFPHPKSGQSMRFSAPLPAEFPFSLFGKSQYEVERKFLIAMPDVRFLESLTGAERLDMTQVYLTAREGVTRRVRRVLARGEERFYLTEKQRLTHVRCVENEREIDGEAYRALLLEARADLRPIEKTRYRLPMGERWLEVDVYPFFQDRAIAEVEVPDEHVAVTLPPYLTCLAEVTEDARYKNVNLAKSVPMDDISAIKNREV